MRESHAHTERQIPSDFQYSENRNTLLGLFHDYKSLIIYDSWKQMWFIRVSHRQMINHNVQANIFFFKGVCYKENSQQLAYSIAPENDDLRHWNIRVDEW